MCVPLLKTGLSPGSKSGSISNNLALVELSKKRLIHRRSITKIINLTIFRRCTVRLLMLGWEFPPFISGGLGTACYGLSRALVRLETEILFVLPLTNRDEGSGQIQEGCKPSISVEPAQETTGSGRISFLAVPSRLPSPYKSGALSWEIPIQSPPVQSQYATALLERQPSLRLLGTGAVDGYDGDLAAKVSEYADRCVRLTRNEQFDAIHAHDWMTFPAGMAIAARSGRPLIVQVHATEFDRSGEYVNPLVYDIERQGMHTATSVIAVSNLTKRIIVERYGVTPDKVQVVHNGIELEHPVVPRAVHKEKTVLFLGRITRQKGPEFFVNAASRVLEKLDNVKFIIAGWGDMAPQVIEQVAAMGLGQKVRFTGFLRGQEVEHAYRMADVYVMPSVSEPFGLTALEAIQHGVPVILSMTSGAAEVLPRGSLKVDFWDTQEIANKIIAVLSYPELAEQLCRSATMEISTLTWDAAAQKCMRVYQETIEGCKNGARKR
jgi:glycogen(starch) synthase